MLKGEATRQRILDEAARQAALKGLTGLSLGDLAEAVGLSKSGLFKHFDSKEAMQLALVDQVLEHFSAFILTAGERKRASEDPRFQLFVVTSALTKPAIHWYKGAELEQRFAFTPLQWRLDQI